MPTAMRLSLRKATEADARSVWEWRNDPQTVAASLSGSEVEWEEHLLWYTKALEDAEREMMILQEGDNAIGVVRFDRIDEQVAEVSINIAPPARRRGVGVRALTLALEMAESGGRYRTLIARVRSDNEASLRAFAAAGFQEEGSEDGVVRFFSSHVLRATGEEP